MTQPNAAPATAHRRAIVRIGSAMVLGASLAACGFKLRGAPQLAFASLYLESSESSVVAEELRRSLESAGVRVIRDNRQLDAAQAILDVVQDQREKAVVGMNASGQVREVQLRIRFKFRLRDPLGKELIPETELLLQRDISYVESAAVAKEAEEALIYRNMQSDIVQQIQQRLAAVTKL